MRVPVSGAVMVGMSGVRFGALGVRETLVHGQQGFLRQSGEGREQVPVTALMPGDVLMVAAGEAVAADGEVLHGAAFDESLLTGESAPVAKPAGAMAFAGSVCRERPARLKVTRTGLPDETHVIVLEYQKS